VTCNTEIHIKFVNLFNPVHFPDIPVASAAINFPVNMYGMSKKTKSGTLFCTLTHSTGSFSRAYVLNVTISDDKL